MGLELLVLVWSVVVLQAPYRRDQGLDCGLSHLNEGPGP